MKWLLKQFYNIEITRSLRYALVLRVLPFTCLVMPFKSRFIFEFFSTSFTHKSLICVGSNMIQKQARAGKLLPTYPAHRVVVLGTMKHFLMDVKSRSRLEPFVTWGTKIHVQRGVVGPTVLEQKPLTGEGGATVPTHHGGSPGGTRRHHCAW